MFSPAVLAADDPLSQTLETSASSLATQLVSGEAGIRTRAVSTFQNAVPFCSPTDAKELIVLVPNVLVPGVCVLVIRDLIKYYIN